MGLSFVLFQHILLGKGWQFWHVLLTNEEELSKIFRTAMIPNISQKWSVLLSLDVPQTQITMTWSCSLDSFANQLTIITAKSTPSINFFKLFLVFSFGMCLNTVPWTEARFPHLSLLSPKFTFTQLSLQAEKAGGT